MTIEIIYGTNSSGTYEAARTIQAELERRSHTVTIQSAKDADPKQIGQADLTILGSCTWERFVDGKKLEGQLQIHMFALANALQNRKLAGKKISIFALGDSSYTNFANAAVHLEALVKKIGAVKVGETLKIDGWFFNLEKNRERVIEWAMQLGKQLA